jgi:hypothetical protein
MPAKKDAATTLAEKLVQTLEAQRHLGPDVYPLTLRRLGELADPAASPELVQKAAAKRKPFLERVAVVQAKNLDAPVFLAEDATGVPASPPVLEFLLNLVCSPDSPTCDAAKLKGKLPVKLRKPFEADLKRRLADKDLPPGVAVIPVKSKTHLHLTRYPLPKPPEVVLAENLVRVLHAERSLGGDSYPVKLSRLVELAQPGAGALVKKALARPAVQEAVLLAVKNHPETPVALAEDRETLAASDTLLELAVTLARTSTDFVVTPAKVKGKVIPPLQRPLEEAIKRRIEARAMPPAVGCLRHGRTWVLFLLSDVLTAQPTEKIGAGSAVSPPVEGVKEKPRVGSQPPETAEPPTRGESPTDFARAFDQAFQQLDRQKGSHNFVSLVDLRRALPVDRQTFDAELANLRRAGRYTLSAAEGRHGVNPEEQEAGIYEDGSLLLYVSRKSSSPADALR